MTFLELINRLRLAVKSPDATELTVPDAKAYVNSGYLDLAGRYPFHQTREHGTLTTVVGQEQYALPDNLTALLSVKNADSGYKLRKAGDRLIANRLTDNYRGEPRKYVRYRNVIELVPTPGSAQTLDIFYLAVPDVLVADADVPILPAGWHDGIWMRAKWYYYLDRGDIAQQSAADAAYKLWLSDKPSEIEEETRDMDSAVELPELTRQWLPRSSRFDDGTFDFRD